MNQTFHDDKSPFGTKAKRAKKKKVSRVILSLENAVGYTWIISEMEVEWYDLKQHILDQQRNYMRNRNDQCVKKHGMHNQRNIVHFGSELKKLSC